MKLHLHHSGISTKRKHHLSTSLEKAYRHYIVLLMLFVFSSAQTNAQGTWTALRNLAPHTNGGGMLLLSDGSVMTKTFSGGTDGYGNLWDKLVPNKKGSYSKGKWKTTIAAMHSTRLYFSEQVLKDGRVYIAGGEYGTGGSAGETYDPLTNIWTNNPSPGARVSDANSEILDNGIVLQALVSGTLKSTKLYDPVANTYTTGPNCIGIHNESAWVKLPDNSILFVDRLTRNSERYIPATNTWIADATLPVDIYDPFGDEAGGALLLPNGKAFFIGSTGHNAIYTPSGNTSNGSWVAAADFPNGQGTPDAAAAMMVNGKVLCATSPIPTSGNHFPSPTSFYEYDYLTNSFTRVNAPGGGLTINISSYLTNLVDLPNGQVLYGQQNSTQYYVYTPGGSALAAGKPVISTVSLISGTTYSIIGTQFNGISEGATYGDDWQMNSNYPIVSLTSGALVYYARTSNWNSTGVMRGSSPDTAQFVLPSGLPFGTYSLVVSANGIASDPVSFTYGPEPVAQVKSQDTRTGADNMIVSKTNEMKVYPNPAHEQTSVQFTLAKASHVSLKVLDANGKAMQLLLNKDLQQGDYSVQLNTGNFSAGIYMVQMITGDGTKNIKLVIQ